MSTKLAKQRPAIERLTQMAGSQKDLARVLGLTEAHVSRLMNGHREAPQYMKIIADLLDILPRKDWPKEWDRG